MGPRDHGKELRLTPGGKTTLWRVSSRGHCDLIYHGSQHPSVPVVQVRVDGGPGWGGGREQRQAWEAGYILEAEATGIADEFAGRGTEERDSGKMP